VITDAEHMIRTHTLLIEL